MPCWPEQSSPTCCRASKGVTSIRRRVALALAVALATYIAVDPEDVPAELTGLTAWVSCVAGARPLSAYAAVAESAGLVVTVTERHTQALRRMIDPVDARLDLLTMTSRPRPQALGVDPDRVASALDANREAISAGLIDYVLLVAEKPRE